MRIKLRIQKKWYGSTEWNFLSELQQMTKRIWYDDLKWMILKETNYDKLLDSSIIYDYRKNY